MFQYLSLLATHRLPGFFMTDGLRTIIAINFLPLLSIAAVISTFAHRRTGDYLPGALVCALFVTWYVVANQPMQVS